MGLSDATCSLTRTNIALQEQVLFVVVDPACLITGRTTHSLMSAISRHESGKATNPFLWVTFGSYDGYGLINGIDPLYRSIYSEIRDCIFMIHKLAVDKFMDHEDTKNISYLVTKAFYARVNLFGNQLLGDQHCSSSQTELDLQRKINAIRDSILNARDMQKLASTEQFDDPGL